MPGTPLKNMETQRGKLARASGWALKPKPTARETAKMVMVLVSGFTLMIICMPLTITMPNVKITAPPNTGVGMTEQRALTFGHKPANTMMTPATATT